MELTETWTVQVWVAIVQGASAVALLVVTLWYVRLTRRISEASERAAESARRSSVLNQAALLEMRAQRFGSSQPLLVGELQNGSMFYHGVPQSIAVQITNVGSGPALRVILEMSFGEVPFSLSDNSHIILVPAGGVATGGVLTFSAPRDHLEGLAQRRDDISGTLCIRYKDIHGRQFTSTLDMRSHPGTNRIVAGDCGIRITDEGRPDGVIAMDLPEKI